MFPTLFKYHKANVFNEKCNSVQFAKCAIQFDLVFTINLCFYLIFLLYYYFQTATKLMSYIEFRKLQFCKEKKAKIEWEIAELFNLKAHLHYNENAAFSR